MTLGALTMVLLGGVLGLAWWSWRHRPGCEPVARSGRVRAAVVAAGLLVISVGAVWRLVVALEPVPACSPPGGGLSASPLTPSVVAQKAATWAETGIGILYSQADGAHVCWSRSANYYVAVNASNIAGSSAMTMGDVVLTPGFDIPRENREALVAHEARHRPQWAVGTVIGGPLAFPIAYAIDDFFFPGSRNHFERQAGLETGGYSSSGTGPVLGPAQLAVLSALAAIIVVALLAARHRRASARSRSGAETPGAGTGRWSSRAKRQP
jgi:hypothetical protein